ncbi:dynamin family protein [Microbacterium ureisolvens]|uniref:Dynamin family protein n=1 Tax=Microbacterium ureisolvens TaxID=2781186 RepID=A0ABS7I2X7_9MICO|nr:dynamin family protein [Microbacterium ureisolvens]MBW9111996.1 dynamin family protein [Microbacterium ureisolvens]
MRVSILDDASALVRAAREFYADDREACDLLSDLERRLSEPIRLALAGMVKAGKSTLLNAMLGERLAPTDAGECTRVVTWYRYSATPTITMHLVEGEQRRMPIRRDAGRLVLDLGGIPPEDVAWIDVGWPSTGLRSLILIDTPGIASLSRDVSARSTDFLVPDTEPSSADAIVYLMRHLHASDLKFLESFRDTAAGASQTVNAVAVLSRADEIGSGRIDSLLSAGKVARRYEKDGDLASLSLGVVPVAGLLAESARTLREDEFAAFRDLASLDRASREALMVSADRFVRPTEATTLSEEVRRELLSRFGIFGVRLASALIRGGAADSSQLSEQLVQQSGLNELQQFIQLQFRTRAGALKVRGVLDALQTLLREKPRDGADAVLGGVERIYASAHTLRELSLLSRARSSGLPLSRLDAEEAERIIGGSGPSPAARLGLPETATTAESRVRVDELLARWRTLSESPLAERATVEVARSVIRSLEEVASELVAVGAGASDVVLAGGPLEGAVERAEQEREEGEGPLREEHLPQDRAVLARGEDLR